MISAGRLRSRQALSPAGPPEAGADIRPLGTDGGDHPHRWIFEWLAVLMVAVGLAFAVRAFVLQTYFIPTPSMEPTLMVGDRILVDKVSYHLHAVDRGDIVVFGTPAKELSDPSITDLVKRVIGLPGETISSSEGRVYIDGKPLHEPWLPPGTVTFSAADPDLGSFPGTSATVTWSALAGLPTNTWTLSYQRLDTSECCAKTMSLGTLRTATNAVVKVPPVAPKVTAAYSTGQMKMAMVVRSSPSGTALPPNATSIPRRMRYMAITETWRIQKTQSFQGRSVARASRGLKESPKGARPEDRYSTASLCALGGLLSRRVVD